MNEMQKLAFEIGYEIGIRTAMEKQALSMEDIVNKLRDSRKARALAGAGVGGLGGAGLGYLLGGGKGALGGGLAGAGLGGLGGYHYGQEIMDKLAPEDLEGYMARLQATEAQKFMNRLKAQQASELDAASDVSGDPGFGSTQLPGGTPDLNLLAEAGRGGGGAGMGRKNPAVQEQVYASKPRVQRQRAAERGLAMNRRPFNPEGNIPQGAEFGQRY